MDGDVKRLGIFIDERKESRLVDEYKRLLSIRMASPDQAVDRVLLVSPPSPTILWPAIEHFAPPAQLEGEHLRHAANAGTRIVASANDPYCPESARSLYAAPLGVDIDVLPTGGHLSEPEGYGPWPSVVAWCREATTRVTTNSPASD